VVGYGRSTFRPEAFRWTEAGGMVGLGDNCRHAYGVSANGSVVVGERRSGADSEAFRWTEAGGLLRLGYLPHLPELSPISGAYGVSANGSVIVGGSTSFSGQQAFRWTESGGMVGLGDLPGGIFSSGARAVSADGSVIVGFGRSVSGLEAFRWTEAGGMIGLGDLPGGIFSSAAVAVSADGMVVVGSSQTDIGSEAFIWDPRNGMRNLKSVLTAGGLNLAGWTLSVARSISADGLTIAGSGINPEGQTEAWRANLAQLQTSVTSNPERLSLGLYLHPNHPNPFNPSTQISYTIPSPGHVDLRVYDARGRSIRTLGNAVQPAGRHDVTWDERDSAGSSVASGVYYLRLTNARGMTTRSITLMK
jgi:probable HAF family extracellular repeat protein